MPFYEYECQSCHRVTEVLQKMSDPPLRKCPSCGKEKMEKLISAAAFRLTGGGWYETDFKSDSDRKRNLAGADKEAKTESPASSSTAETQSSSKSESKADSTSSSKSTEAKPAAAEKPAASAAPASAPKRAGPASRSARPSAKQKAKAPK